jgi:gamma-glutamylcyclotransferase (GGCT)/AIG2-like uncharacterized protein YtfP
MTKKIRYFAYGSNMLSEWLSARCPSATPRAVAFASGHRLSFAKQSKYGSGKATIEQAPGARVYGVVSELPESELNKLDRAEGPGYERTELNVHLEDSEDTVDAFTYVAKPMQVDQGLKPCDWYLDLIVAGAQQHGVPPNYIEDIEAMPSMIDPVPDQSGGREALKMLRRIGFSGRSTL